MASIGAVLKEERERRGLSLEDAHDATRITVQNLSALEEDKFDYFPNRVYARAFLRDYANYLGLDSVALLKIYEQDWNPVSEPEPVAVRRTSPWKAIGYTVLVLAILGVFAALYYNGLTGHTFKLRGRKSETTPTSGQAVLPKPAVVPGKPETSKPAAPAKPTVGPKPSGQPKPQPVPATPSTVKVEITATRKVWVRAAVDGQNVLPGSILPTGTTKTLEGKKSVFVREGMGDALQIKVNGQVQPPLGSPKKPAEKTFVLPAAPTPAAAPAPSTAASKPSGVH